MKKSIKAKMNRKSIQIALLLTLLLVGAAHFLWQELKVDFEAINYIEGEGYSSVRLLYELPAGHGCSAKDVYRFAFDGIPHQNERRVSGKICSRDGSVWYEDIQE